LVFNSCSGFSPVPEERLCLQLLRGIVNESFPSIHLVDNCDVNHRHDHYPEVKDVLKEHKLSYSFVLGSKGCLINMHESKHPGTIHKVCDGHCLVLKRKDPINPVVELGFINCCLCRFKASQILVSVKHLEDLGFILLEVDAL